MPLPPLTGLPIRVRVRASLGPYHASTSIRRRLIHLDSGVLARRGEFERILLHELFHFVWVRFSNARRRDWEELLRRELSSGVSGELGWSAEWRKDKLLPSSSRRRSLRWRRYACESFCDTGAWVFAGIREHDEFTLRARARRQRRMWFRDVCPTDADLPV